METILFYAFAAVAALSGLLAVSRKNAVASACWLVVMFFGLAAIYVLLEAYFVAAVQILVYAGAIMVLFLFVIMLLDLRTSQLESHTGPKLGILGVVLAGAFTAVALRAVNDASADPKIADRVTAVLHRPTPAAVDPKDPLEVPAPPVAPPPVDVELHEVAVVPTPSELGAAGDEQRGDRAYEGDLALVSGAPPARFRVTVSPDGALEGIVTEADRSRVVGTIPPTPGAARSSTPVAASFAIGSVPGATVDVTVQRGGLEPRVGGGPDGSPQAIGKALFEDWLLPFEIVSLLLTGAIFGAVVLTKRRLP